MTTYKTVAKNKQTGERVLLEMDYPTKSAFIADIRANGYAVTDYEVKEASAYDWIIANTNCEKWDWKEN